MSVSISAVCNNLQVLISRILSGLHIETQLDFRCRVLSLLTLHVFFKSYTLLSLCRWNCCLSWSQERVNSTCYSSIRKPIRFRSIQPEMPIPSLIIELLSLPYFILFDSRYLDCIAKMANLSPWVGDPNLCFLLSFLYLCNQTLFKS